MTPLAAFEALNRAAGIAPLAAPKFVRSDLPGEAFIGPTPFRLALAAAAALGFGGAVAGEFWRFRGGERQRIDVDVPVAAASLAAFTMARRNGAVAEPAPPPSAAVGLFQTGPTPPEGYQPGHYQSGAYQTARRWLYLDASARWHAPRLLDLLNASDEAAGIGVAVARWNGLALEDALAFMGVPGALVRSAEEAAALFGSPPPPIVLIKTGEAPVLRPEASATPLGGIRVLDLSCRIGGAAAGFGLAAHGGDVLQIVSPRYPVAPVAFGGGKRRTALDLQRQGDAETLHHLVRGAGVFIDGYRPGALAALGFSPHMLAHACPGIVTVSIAGFYGPWAARRGLEGVVQAASGMAYEQGGRGLPEILPAPVLSVLTGYLASAGVVAALLRRVREGGSWHVTVSLAATAAWLLSLGRIDAGARRSDPPGGLDPYLYSCETKDGWFELLGPVVRMEKTPPIQAALPDGLVPPHW